MDFGSFMLKVHKSLRDNGKIVFTIPLSISSPLEQATKDAIRSPRWAEFFKNYVEIWRVLNAKEYEQMILDSNFTLISSDVITQRKIFDSRRSLENYIIQWHPYVNYIDSPLREELLEEVVDGYLEIEPPSSSGSVNFEFPRIDLIASKK